MNAKNPTFWISACVIALLAEPGVTQAQTRADADVVTAISNLENDAVKAFGRRRSLLPEVVG
jgi:hypothetical protein